MKKFFALLCLCLAAIVAAVCANSCQKPVEEIDTGLSINGKAVPFQSVVISFNDEEDGACINLYDADGSCMGLPEIQFAASLIETRIDLSVPDVYAESEEEHWNHDVAVIQDRDDEERVYEVLSWGGPDDTDLADDGSYLLVKKLEPSNYQIDMYCKSNGYEVELHYKGYCRETSTDE